VDYLVDILIRHCLPLRVSTPTLGIARITGNAGNP
jgi:hypothetical protein